MKYPRFIIMDQLPLGIAATLAIFGAGFILARDYPWETFVVYMGVNLITIPILAVMLYLERRENKKHNKH